MITFAFQKVQSSGSQLEAISPQGHLGMCGDIFACQDFRKGIATSI